jgi:hypothetical protein
VFDVTGAGDTVLAYLCLGLGAGADLLEAASLANLAAGAKVAKVGTSPVGPAEVAAHGEEATGPGKIVDLEQAVARVAHLRSLGRRVVLTNGASTSCMRATFTCWSVRAPWAMSWWWRSTPTSACGDSRARAAPVVRASDRVRVLAALASVGLVLVFDEDTPLEVIRRLRPDVLVKGGDYTQQTIVGADLVLSWGGEVATVPLVEGRSTTGLLRACGRSRDEAALPDPKSGDVLVAELPAPALRPGTLLVRNACSVVSPGTERAMVSRARSSYLTTGARPARPGAQGARHRAAGRGDRRLPEGEGEDVGAGGARLLLAGHVVAVAEDAGDWFRVGDRVACAGQGIASHAEMVCVPVNLAARIPEGVTFEAAAFSTLGAIALHGVRTADLRLGERAAVIGSGLLGLLTVQLLRARGSAAPPSTSTLGWRHGRKHWGRRSALPAASTTRCTPPQLDGRARAWTRCWSRPPARRRARWWRRRAWPGSARASWPWASSPSGYPARCAYMKGAGAAESPAPTGPGRYDLAFEEERGRDYPPAYVRWTETRNLRPPRLLREGQGGPWPPSSRTCYDLEQGPAAYEALTAGTGPRPWASSCATRTGGGPSRGTARCTSSALTGQTGVAFVGPGAFAAGCCSEVQDRGPVVVLRRVVTAHGLTAEDARVRFGFQEIAPSPGQVFSDPSVLAGLHRHPPRHHAALAASALRAGKHVFVEKPLALNEGAAAARSEEALAASRDS